jgi:hypothetical protein
MHDPVLKLYLPDLQHDDGTYKNINREFLFNVINTLKPQFFPENIRGLMKARKELQVEKNKNFIEIKSDFYNLISSSQLMAKSKC